MKTKIRLVEGISIVLMAFVMLLIFTPRCSAKCVCIRGDANGDGKIDIADVTTIQRKLAEMDVATFVEYAADINGDGLAIGDATILQKYLAEFDNSLDIGEYTGCNGQRIYYYLSLTDAVADFNSNTTVNSRDASEGAAVIAYFDEGSSHIMLLDDIAINSSLAFDSKTILDLNGKTIEFVGESDITYNNDLTISNGEVDCEIHDSFISQGNMNNSSLTLSELIINADYYSQNAASELSVLKTHGSSVKIDNVAITGNIAVDSATCSYSFLSGNEPSSTSITNSVFNFSSNGVISGSVYALKTVGETYIYDSTITADFDKCAISTQRLYGAFSEGVIEIRNSSINLTTSTSGENENLIAAVINSDDNEKAITRVYNSEIKIINNTSSNDYETTYGIRMPYGGVADIEGSTLSIETTADGRSLTSSKVIEGIAVYGSDRALLTSYNNTIKLNCHLSAERTDSDYKIYQIGYDIRQVKFFSTSDTIRCTTDTIYNNIINSQAVKVSKSAEVKLDNIYAFVTSQPSYVEGSDGMSPCMRFTSSNVNITNNSGDNYVHGSHCGIMAGGDNMNLTVKGGTYESPSHGGFYFTGQANSLLSLDGVKSLNTQNYYEHFDSKLLGAQGALYICDFGGNAQITNSYIYGGKFGLRIKYYKKLDDNGIDTNAVHHTDVTVNDTYIYGDYYGIHDDLCSGMGVLTVGEDVDIEFGGLSPEESPSYDILTYRGADVVDNRIK